MPEITESELASRVRALALDAPASEAITAKVIDRHRAAPVARRGFGFRFAAAAVVLVIVLASVGYFVPAFGLAVADTPVGGWVTRAAGLGDVSDRITGLDDSSSARGLTLRLAGGYADSARTVLLVDLPPNSSNALIESAALTDQFGVSYAQLASVQDVAVHHAGLIFEPVSGLASRTGARLTLHIDALRTTDSADVPGPWDLRAVLVVDGSTRHVSIPPDSQIGGHRVHVTGAIAIRHGIALTIAFPDLSPADLTGVISDGTPKGRPALELTLTTQSTSIQPFMCQLVDSAGAPAFDCLWLAAPGEYSLLVDYAGATTTMPVAVPAGR